MPQSTRLEKKLKLAPGRTVPMEDGRDWPEGGATVPVTLYIRRRIADGDLVEAGATSAGGVKAPAAPVPTGTDSNTNDDAAAKAKNGGK
ncbi:DUF2635 domain-containing protein [Brucella anthropi]|uniref:DUF2635 domain-containing protein n=1 Tax=Brucella anthropi TaxID=529 RepID=UPI002447463C|nr:DUF2635 domain-containing protein [Brucella anthropi]MDG9793734.1 DUF2635 domain-containing protein [Brucella anthropi]MDH0583611.1 DUF2635 domain-containing protein [Brucella anthropi]MDH0820137.1 DUF2635 domain-containing protein [Brucella anthropi]MDH2086968.1 DUF2635 domain-containing protein [Brucella anthropi]